MPELPDITIYCEALTERIVGRRLERIRVTDVFVLRTARPPVDSLEQHTVTGIRRIGKRIAIGFDHNAWLVIHLMIAGRLQWSDPGAKVVTRNALATLLFENGALVLTEAGTKRRASIHVLDGDATLAAHDPGGIDVFSATNAEFAHALTRENHTLKRVLTDPRVFSGIGNAYSDEVLHAARLSPLVLSQKLTAAEIDRLHLATQETLRAWSARLRAESAGRFPAHVTAFRPEMAVHGKFGQPCPVCGTKVQRIVYAENEVNYCPRCQTGGKLLADRSLSRLLKSDWPKTIDELE
ncbi:MAG TPA: DNA-formamidopyrimidine glycosylase family protein [Opitutaceae bacterium]|nr:DNA-formamidopyrimidine glycosylase family protein [Opitutaceae bacterium]